MKVKKLFSFTLGAIIGFTLIKRDKRKKALSDIAKKEEWTGQEIADLGT